MVKVGSSTDHFKERIEYYYYILFQSIDKSLYSNYDFE